MSENLKLPVSETACHWLISEPSSQKLVLPWFSGVRLWTHPVPLQYNTHSKKWREARMHLAGGSCRLFSETEPTIWLVTTSSQLSLHDFFLSTIFPPGFNIQLFLINISSSYFCPGCFQFFEGNILLEIGPKWRMENRRLNLLSLTRYICSFDSTEEPWLELNPPMICFVTLGKFLQCLVLQFPSL